MCTQRKPPDHTLRVAIVAVVVALALLVLYVRLWQIADGGGYWP